MSEKITEIPVCRFCRPRLRPENYFHEDNLLWSFDNKRRIRLIDLNEDAVNPVIGNLAIEGRRFSPCAHLLALRVGGKLVSGQFGYEDRCVLWLWRHPWLKSNPKQAIARELLGRLLLSDPHGTILGTSEFHRQHYATDLPNRAVACSEPGDRAYGVRIDVLYAAWPEWFLIRYEEYVRAYGKTRHMPPCVLEDVLLENLGDDQ